MFQSLLLFRGGVLGSCFRAGVLPELEERGKEGQEGRNAENGIRGQNGMTDGIPFTIGRTPTGHVHGARPSRCWTAWLGWKSETIHGTRDCWLSGWRFVVQYHNWGSTITITYACCRVHHSTSIVSVFLLTNSTPTSCLGVEIFRGT